MADDVTLPGFEKVVATDEIGKRHFQKVKIVIGEDGTADDLTSEVGLKTRSDFTEVLLVELIQQSRLTNLFLSRLVGEDLKPEDLEDL